MAACADQTVFIVCYFRSNSKSTRPDIRYKSVARLTYYLGSRIMGDESSRTLRRTGLPNPEEYKKARNKFKTWDASAITEFQRLRAVNARDTLTASKSPHEDARYYHLCELKSRREFVVVFSIFVFR
jgi:hypothetical protein